MVAHTKNQHLKCDGNGERKELDDCKEYGVA